MRIIVLLENKILYSKKLNIKVTIKKIVLLIIQLIYDTTKGLKSSRKLSIFFRDFQRGLSFLPEYKKIVVSLKFWIFPV